MDAVQLWTSEASSAGLVAEGLAAMTRGCRVLVIVAGVLAMWLGEQAYALSLGDVYIPRTDVHLKCQFADGSFAEYRRRKKWFFYAELFPHAQTHADLDSSRRYVDAAGRERKGLGPRQDDCLQLGKRNGRYFDSNGFENNSGKFANFSFPEQSEVPAPPWQKFPKMIPAGLVDQPTEIRAFTAQEHLHSGYEAQVVPLNTTDDRALLFEQPLTAFEHPKVPNRVVIFVYQSTSPDYGQTWSTPVITKDAKLFEIGRKVGEQSWSPKLKMLERSR